MTLTQVITRLKTLANPEKASYKEAKFHIVADTAMGIYMQDINALAKEIGKDTTLAIALFNTGLYDARILSSKILNPKDVTREMMENWVVAFTNWEICDSFSMCVFSKSPYAVDKIFEWSLRTPEFEKRAAFATLASYCTVNKEASNEIYTGFLPLLVRESQDDRVYVKKAINWALRSIGKRNPDLNKSALKTAYTLLESNNTTAQWIAKNAIKELTSTSLKTLDYPRAIYRTS